jgi:cytochrome P450
VSAPAFDLTDLDTYQAGFPHEIFTWLRASAPLYRHEPTAHTPQGEAFWVASRHADALAIQLDPKRFSSVTGGSRERGGTMISDQLGAGLMLNMMDDPRHRRIRGLVNKGFTPHRIGALEPELRRRARAILDAVPANGACDFVTDVARELPLHAICLLLGVPQQDRAMLCDWMDRGLEAESGEALNREYGRMLSAYGVELIRAKREQPGDDLLSVVIQARMPEEDPPALGDDELMFFFSLLFTAGSETTRKAIAGGLRALVENPAELARLRDEPGLLDLAVEEMVRWTTPSVYKRRTATCDLELHGEKIRAGDQVLLMYAAANRDPEVFADPETFDVGRNPNPHVAFGFGPHFCLGAMLARMEIRVMFEELLARFPEMEITGEVSRLRSNFINGIKHIPLRVG